MKTDNVYTTTDNILDSIFNNDNFAIKNNRKKELKDFLNTTITASDFHYTTILVSRGYNGGEGLLVLVFTDFCFYQIYVDAHSQTSSCVCLKSFKKIDYEQCAGDIYINVAFCFTDFKNTVRIDTVDHNTIGFFHLLRIKASNLK